MRIAHITDLHLVEASYRLRSAATRLRIEYLSFTRTIDPDERAERALRAVARAAALSDHVVVSGDLTEDGTEDQFERLAEILSMSGVQPERITLVPGNHDACDRTDGFSRALRGPLHAFRATSTPGLPYSVGDQDGCLMVPISSVVDQRLPRASGFVDSHTRETLEELVRSPRSKPIVVVQHHPPLQHLPPVVQWIDGIRSGGCLTELLIEDDSMFVLCGHTHASLDLAVAVYRDAQVFSAPALVDDPDALRVYRIVDQRLVPDLDGEVSLRRSVRPSDQRAYPATRSIKA